MHIKSAAVHVKQDLDWYRHYAGMAKLSIKKALDLHVKNAPHTNFPAQKYFILLIKQRIQLRFS